MPTLTERIPITDLRAEVGGQAARLRAEANERERGYEQDLVAIHARINDQVAEALRQGDAEAVTQLRRSEWKLQRDVASDYAWERSHSR
jgi:hypothetical protein